ncbi:MAG: reverse transcriptase domain-containing protein [Halomonas sp.]
MLFDEIVGFDNLVTAYHAARRGKRYRPEVVRYSANLEENLINLHNHLVWESWRPSSPREFTVLEPKMRLIQAPPFEDRIVHHALVDVVEPMFERRFIHHSYACRKGRGTHAAIFALQGMLRRARARWPEVWVLQADVRQFFATVQHSTVIEGVARVVPSPRAVRLWQTVLAGYGYDDGVGLPVGALSSQMSANVVMDGVDHEMTDQHGAGRYLRYMDDVIVLAPTKAEAWLRYRQLQDALEYRGLALNPKTQVRPARSGVDWCGYRTWSTHILPRKRNIRRIRKNIARMGRRYSRGEASLEEVRQHVNSLRAYTQHCQGGRTTRGILGQIVLKREAHDADHRHP